ncbi:hypothetical protein PR001_g33520 [Phytophthora rubi]|uniref:Uncharacterized protein n=1 Tax=Phytophthora rubi TaxID=129364 RepID=A0A6A3G4I1_9STRA|nr:hypothetical protein PR001_g33520 [Phytophthora rubi]
MGDCNTTHGRGLQPWMEHMEDTTQADVVAACL